MNKLILAIVLLLACSSLGFAQTTMQVSGGEKFTLTLESNPSTGYHWQLARPLDETKVKLVSSTYKRPNVQRPGAPGEELWEFLAAGPGKTTIDMEYVRPWEKGVPPAKTASFAISVK